MESDLVASDGTYLGRVTVNPFDADSISNPSGRYGSPFSRTSIRNPFGRYGSPFSPDSAFNDFRTRRGSSRTTGSSEPRRRTRTSRAESTPGDCSPTPTGSTEGPPGSRAAVGPDATERAVRDAERGIRTGRKAIRAWRGER